jgi:cytochrome c peroxidase
MNNLEVLLSCPICNKKYGRGDVRFVEERKGLTLFHTNCKFCHNSSLAVYSKRESGEGSVALGVLTELDFDEIKSVFQRKAMTTNEFLDFYQMISRKFSNN